MEAHLRPSGPSRTYFLLCPSIRTRCFENGAVTPNGAPVRRWHARQ